MKQITAICLTLLFLAGCAAYKELEPKPVLLPQERGYIELKNDQENFKLDKDTKYFIKFPRPDRDNFYLVLSSRSKPALYSYLAFAFDNGAPPGARIKDETPGNDTLMVFPVDMRVPTFFWVIDSVRYDVELWMRYRYVPRWRFTFENKYAALRELLANNRIDPSTYNSIGPGYTFQGMNLARELEKVEGKTEHLKAIKSDLEEVHRLFPPDIESTRDTAYERYLALRSDLEDETLLQENYSSVLRVFDREQSSRGNAAAFLGGAPVYLDFMAHRDRQRPPVVEAVRSLLLGRLPETMPYYEGLLNAKNNFERITLDPSLDVVDKLYRACDQQPPESFRSLTAFVNRFNVESGGVYQALSRLSEIDRIIKHGPAWGSDSLFVRLISLASQAKAALPEQQLDRFEPWGSYNCARLLSEEIVKTASKAVALQSLYERGRGVAERISSESWASAEDQLRNMNTSAEYDAVPSALDQKHDIVSHLEGEIFSRVKRATQQRVDAFVAKNESTIDDVPALYRDSAFTPVYDLTFSAGGPAQLAQNKRQISDYLTMMKTVRFPENAIRGIYGQFVRNPSARGVDRARAIVEHGKEYKGSDKQVEAMIDECDASVPKWIVRPKDYRKVYALPVTSNARGTNEYLFRLGLKIPSEAQFPVFDVNIKLPQEVAEKAGKEQWYKLITINKKPIKNEGRFRITSPTPENNYESLITPVQMDKEGNNVLEVRFMYPGYRVFEVSAMAQPPIIRKN